MRLTWTDFLFYHFLWIKRNKWLGFRDQKIYKTKAGYHNAVKKFLHLGWIMQKQELINSYGGCRLVITLNDFEMPILEDFGECLDWILKN